MASGFPWDPRLWAAFFLHDLGYLSCPNVEGPEGEEHVRLGARIMGVLFGSFWADFTLRHSRYWAKKHGVVVSKLCYADKLAFVLTPGWLYLPMARATGELAEYMAKSRDRQAGCAAFSEDERTQIESGDPKLWLRTTPAAGCNNIGTAEPIRGRLRTVRKKDRGLGCSDDPRSACSSQPSQQSLAVSCPEENNAGQCDAAKETRR